MKANRRTIGGVEIFIRGTGAADQPDILIESVATWADAQSTEIQIDHFCPECGASDHGRPLVRFLAELHSPPAVSRSRCGRYEAVALAGGGSVGVDIESIARVAAFPIDDVFLRDEERSAMDGLPMSERSRALTVLWTAKEAVLKAGGVGLALDPRLLYIRTRSDGTLRLEAMPDRLRSARRVEIATFDVTPDIVGAVALIRS